MLSTFYSALHTFVDLFASNTHAHTHKGDLIHLKLVSLPTIQQASDKFNKTTILRTEAALVVKGNETERAFQGVA